VIFLTHINNINQQYTHMKLKLTVLAFTAAAMTQAYSATFLISNVVAGDTTDTLFQNGDGSLLSGGIVALGYFDAGLPSSSIDDITSIINAFTVFTSSAVGGESVDLGGSFAGYVQAPMFQGASIPLTSPLLGKGVYIFAGNAATLATSTEWALGFLTNIAADVPLEQQYTANPTGVSTVGDIGSLGTFTGDPGTGASGTYNTFQLQPIPEPSAALLGALGALGLLRRRRI
jgi:hypothetical protein